MKKLFISVTTLLITSTLSFSQCSETDVTRVLLIGDSWANFMGIDNTINTVFEKWGHSNYKFYTNATLAVNGSVTSDFLQPAKLTEIQNQLNANPDIDMVHLSLGGNDVLNSWDVSFTQFQTDSLLDSVYSRLVTLIDFIKLAKPGVRVLWSGYAYPNFGEIIEDQAPFQATHPFYATWQNMGFPTFTELNGILNSYSQEMILLDAADPQVAFVPATGIMQYTFGQNNPLTVPPGGTYAPFTVPLPEGLTNYPSPKASMRNYLIFKDCFHLSPQGYNDFIDYHTRKYYHKALMDDQYLISQGGNRDGSVSSTGTVSQLLQMGNSGTDDYSAVLSFGTSAMPDTGVSAASIFLRRESLSGTNPIGNSLQMKIVSGNFSGSADVEPSDYTDPGNGTDIPCQFGSSGSNGHWIRLEIPSSLLPFITNDTLTQFMISAPGAAGLVTFTGASDPELAPVLNITYGITTGLSELIAQQSEVFVYPNPGNGLFYVGTSGTDVTKIEVYDAAGKLILSKTESKNHIDLSNHHQGLYLFRIETTGGMVTKKVMMR